MELAVLSLYENDQGPIYPSEAQTNLVGEWFIISHKTKQNTGVMVIMEKFWPRKNQSERLETTFGYNIEFIPNYINVHVDLPFTLLNLRSEMNNQHQILVLKH